jgi:hypothetical protein
LVFVLDQAVFYIVEIEIYRLSIALLLLEDLALGSHHLLEDTGNAQLAMDLLPTVFHLFYYHFTALATVLLHFVKAPIVYAEIRVD